jgi:hypothetical protein
MKFSSLIFFILIFNISQAQIGISFSKFQSDSILNKEMPKKWEHLNKIGFDFSQVAFVNWNAGGSNSISALLRLFSSITHKHNNLVWISSARTRYGVNKQENQKLRKTEDEIELISTIGYRKDKFTNWYYSARFNFKTQLTNGYNYPDRDNEISRFMAPGYLFLGGGAEYGKNLDQLSIYMSPLTFKSTFVLDKDLSNTGSFGVIPAILDQNGNIIKEGQRIRTELGILITSSYAAQIIENINLMNNLSLYTDYLNSFGNIDVDWEVVFDFKVNDFVKATLGTHLRYDNDVKILEETDIEDEFIEKGAQVQLKQLLGIGVVLNF